METEVIMFDSEEAAQYRTDVCGWVSRNGRFYGNDERIARYDGCTHKACEDCGKPIEKTPYIVCGDCLAKRNKKRYEAMPKETWDGVGMIYSQSADKYFPSLEDAEDFIEDEGGTLEDLMLIICKPNYLPLLDSDYGCDELAEDGELPDEAVDAIETFNSIIKEIGPISWSPGTKAVLLT